MQITLLTINHVNSSIIVLVCVNFISFRLFKKIRDKRKMMKMNPTQIDPLIRIGIVLRKAKRLREIIKNVKIHDIEIIIP
jgi:hypothetical protein